MSHSAADRRQHLRFAVRPMYTSVRVRLLHEERFSLEGHAYDLSEGGVQFELDYGVEPGTPVAVELQLPLPVLAAAGDTGPGRSLFVFGNVVWLDDSEPGPVRLAIAFTRFARQGDQERLRRCLKGGALAKAA
jgi:hypothetical protein